MLEYIKPIMCYCPFFYVRTSGEWFAHTRIKTETFNFSPVCFPSSERNWIIDWLDVENCYYYYCYRCCCCLCVFLRFCSVVMVFFLFLTCCFQCYSESVCWASLCAQFASLHLFIFRSAHDLNVQRQFFFMHVILIWSHWWCDVEIEVPNGTMPNDFRLNNFQHSKESRLHSWLSAIGGAVLTSKTERRESVFFLHNMCQKYP